MATLTIPYWDNIILQCWYLHKVLFNRVSPSWQLQSFQRDATQISGEVLYTRIQVVWTPFCGSCKGKKFVRFFARKGKASTTLNKTIFREILPGHFLSWFLSPVNRQIRISTLKCDPGKLNVNLSFSVQRISYANVTSSSKLEPTIQGKVIVQFFFTTKPY